jgi:hypothetical protein
MVQRVAHPDLFSLAFRSRAFASHTRETFIAFPVSATLMEVRRQRRFEFSQPHRFVVLSLSAGTILISNSGVSFVVNARFVVMAQSGGLAIVVPQQMHVGVSQPTAGFLECAELTADMPLNVEEDEPSNYRCEEHFENLREKILWLTLAAAFYHVTTVTAIEK